MFSLLAGLGTAIVKGISGAVKRKQELKQAVHDNKMRLASSAQSHNQDWEMKQLDNAGWKDDVLFYAVLGLWVWSAIDPAAAGKVFETWKNTMPEYIVEITSWLVAAVLGVKKIGDYLPGAIKGIRDAVGKESK